MTSLLIENLPLQRDDACMKKTADKVTAKPRLSWKEFIQRKNGVRVYICNSNGCKKVFKYLSSLVKHERIHRDERPYACKVCYRSFVQSSNLKRHEKLHTGEKTLECLACLKKFSTASALKQHQQIHGKDGQRKHYDYHQCGRRYLYSSSLSKHTKCCEGVSKSGISEKTEGLENKAEEPIFKKLVKIEETQSDQNTQPETNTTSSYSISLIETLGKLANPPSVSINNCSFAKPQVPVPLLQQSMLNYPINQVNNLLLSNLFIPNTCYSPIQSLRQQELNNFVIINSMLPITNFSDHLILKQKVQNSFLLNTNFPFGYNAISFF